MSDFKQYNDYKFDKEFETPLSDPVKKVKPEPTAFENKIGEVMATATMICILVLMISVTIWIAKTLIF